MTDNELFNTLFQGGNFALPYLIKFVHEGNVISLVNNNEDVLYNGTLYKASSFSYERPDNQGNGGSLSITCIDNELIEFVEDATPKYSLEVVGIIDKLNGTIQPLRIYKHFYGSVSYGDDMTLEFSLGKDDRLDLQFCPYVFDTDNNPSNA